ncbi:helix-turn-helix transcriptional regulator [Paraburkholderia sp. J94]|uniref:helix-turn-helix transcriptional regulator n=1 Tax=Paraburkholderia sp. J94 TaxID=2805441 RepID=UPI002AB17D8A|nr:LuxR C-terminal-related transcriptional regulator [Paraburkholderia sp. J94]
MKSNELQYDRLLHTIYETIERPSAWKDFCAELRKSTGAASVHLCAFERQRELFSWADGFSLLETEPLERIRPLYRDDPRLDWLRRAPPGAWRHCGPQPSPHDARDDTNRHPPDARAPAPETCLLAAGPRYVSLCKLIDSGTLTAILALRGDAQNGPFPEPARALLERLTPHLMRAARVTARRHVPDADALASRARAPAMLVNAGGEVLDSNDAAQRLLRATSLVRVRGRRLALAAPHQARFLEDVAISEARLKNRVSGARAAAARLRALRIVAGEGLEGVAQDIDTALLVPGAPGLSGASGPEVLYAFYNVLTPGDASAAEPHAVAALMFYHPRSAPAVDEQVLAEAFDLSPAECRIVHLLVEGHTQKEIAARVGVQHDTVRKQLQSIFQKTATRRQPDLLRLLMNLPAFVPPGD